MGVFIFSPTLSPSGELVAALASPKMELDLVVLSPEDGSTVRNLTKLGTGTLIVTGSSANTYGGLTSVESGVLGLAKTHGAQAIPGDLSIGDYIGTDTVRLLADNQIPGAVPAFAGMTAWNI